MNSSPSPLRTASPHNPPAYWLEDGPKPVYCRIDSSSVAVRSCIHHPIIRHQSRTPHVCILAYPLWKSTRSSSRLASGSRLSLGLGRLIVGLNNGRDGALCKSRFHVNVDYFGFRSSWYSSTVSLADLAACLQWGTSKVAPTK